MIYAKILGTGSYLPEKILTNHDLEKLVETNDAWIVERTGIRERHVAAEHETAASLAKLASEQALQAANLDANALDLIIVATVTGDRIFPSTACKLQHLLGASAAAAFDVNAACAGFNYAVNIAEKYIRCGAAKNVLLVGSEVLSRVVNWQDRGTCILFGDGAGAMILGASSEPGILASHIHADGQHGDLLYLPNPLANPQEKHLGYYVGMQGNEVFKFAVNQLGNLVAETLANTGIQQQQINWLIPHQANLRIIKAVAKRLQLPLEKVVITIDTHGNTSSASVPLALDVAVRDGRIKRGHYLLLEGFGGGFAWGSSLIKY